MRILVLSDLHSNATALDAVLDAAKDRWDISVCLGDVVGYGPDPNEVTARLEVLQIHPRASESFAALRIELPRRYLLNPGSIGQPRDGDPRAAFAIADLEHQVIEFWRVPYDISVVQQRMRAAHLPEPLVQRLLLGR